MATGNDAAELIELYFQKGWTDGLPVAPPSESSVGAMLESAGLKGSDVIAEIGARNTVVTADKVAINAVMAGCLPEYMPVLGGSSPSESRRGSAARRRVSGHCGMDPFRAVRADSRGSRTSGRLRPGDVAGRRR